MVDSVPVKTELSPPCQGENRTILPNGAVEYRPRDYWRDSGLPTWMQRVVTDVFIFVSIHYNVWVLPCLLLFYFLVQHGYSFVVVSLVAVYLPSLLDGAQSTAKGRTWEALRTWPFFHAVTSLLRMKSIREVPLDASKPYVFGFQPHGILILSRLATYGGMWEEMFPNITYRFLGASILYRIPLARELCLWMGGVDASRSTAEKILQAGSSVVVFPGGVPEIFLVDPKSNVNEIYLRKRLGFVKLAMRNGADLVPVFVFGEKWLYNVWRPSKQVIDFVRKTLHFPLIVFWGRFLWMPMAPPETKSFGVVYGKPLGVRHVKNPTDEEVQVVHAQYMKEVERLFHQHKRSFGYDDDQTLVII